MMAKKFMHVAESGPSIDAISDQPADFQAKAQSRSQARW
jgi:hypothetical protein